MSIDFQFKRGDIVRAFDEIAVIVDVLHSEQTGNLCIYVRFIRNLGNTRPYDMLEVSPERTLGVETWTPATPEDLEEALKKRREVLSREIDELRALTQPAAADVAVEVV